MKHELKFAILELSVCNVKLNEEEEKKQPEGSMLEETRQPQEFLSPGTLRLSLRLNLGGFIWKSLPDHCESWRKVPSIQIHACNFF